jgi:hypothetical protein
MSLHWWAKACAGALLHSIARGHDCLVVLLSRQGFDVDIHGGPLCNDTSSETVCDEVQHGKECSRRRQREAAASCLAACRRRKNWTQKCKYTGLQVGAKPKPRAVRLSCATSACAN